MCKDMNNISFFPNGNASFVVLNLELCLDTRACQFKGGGPLYSVHYLLYVLVSLQSNTTLHLTHYLLDTGSTALDIHFLDFSCTPDSLLHEKWQRISNRKFMQL